MPFPPLPSASSPSRLCARMSGANSRASRKLESRPVAFKSLKTNLSSTRGHIMSATDELDDFSASEPRRGRGSALWPFWPRVYANGDPLPDLRCKIDRPDYGFDEGDSLPEEYRTLLMKMLRHEGE